MPGHGPSRRNHQDQDQDRDGEPRTAASTVTQFLSSDYSSMLLYVHIDRKDY